MTTTTDAQAKTEIKAIAKARIAKQQQISEKPKTKYHIRNWGMYNESFKKRGNITLWIDVDVLAIWKASPEAVQLRGG